MNEDELSAHISKISNVTNGEYMQELDEYIRNLDPSKLIELSCNTIMLKGEVPISAIRISFILLNRSKKFILSRWNSLPISNRDFIKEVLITGILSGDIPTRNSASAVYAFVVDADKPFGISNHILDEISQHIINNEISDQSKVGFIFAFKEMIQINVLSPNFDFYLHSFQVFVQYLLYILSNHYKFEDDFLSIIDCYNCILPFYQKPLNDSEQFKEQIIASIQVILNNETKSNYHDRLYYFLFIIFRTCYTTITNNMEQVFQITISSFSREKEDLILPSVHFWKEVADFENQLINEDTRNREQSIKSDIVVHNIVSVVSKELIGPIAEFMIKYSNEEPPSENTEDVISCIEASETLLSFSRISPLIFDFVQNNFDEMVASPEKKIRYVAIILLRCITSGPNEHDQVVFFSTHFEQIISMINDPAPLIKDAVLWIIDEIFGRYQAIATDDNYFSSLGKVLIDSPYEPVPLAIRACDIVKTIGTNFESIRDKSPIFETAFPDLIKIMRKMLEREEAPLSILGSHCTVALVSLIRSTPTSHEDIIVDLLKSINEQIRSEISSTSIVPTEYVQTIIQYLCIVIWAIVCRLDTKVDPYSEPVLETLLVLLAKKSIICHEDGLLALSRLIAVLKEKIKPFIPKIIEIFVISQESKMVEIVKMSSYLIYRLFNSIGTFMASEQEFNQTIIRVFFENLNDENMFITAKIEILNAMSEMVKFLKLTIVNDFESQFKQFQNFFITNQENLDIETVCHLCAAILNGYQSLINVAAETNNFDYIIFNYKEVTKLFMKMVTFKSNMTKGLMKAIVSFLKEVLKYKVIYRRVNSQLNKSCVTSILCFISNNCDDKALGFDASSVHEAIIHC